MLKVCAAVKLSPPPPQRFPVIRLSKSKVKLYITSVHSLPTQTLFNSLVPSPHVCECVHERDTVGDGQ